MRIVSSVYPIVKVLGGFGGRRLYLARRLAAIMARFFGKFGELGFGQGKNQASFYRLYFVLGEQLIEGCNAWGFPENVSFLPFQAIVATGRTAASEIASEMLYLLSARALAKPSRSAADAGLFLKNGKAAKLPALNLYNPHGYIIQEIAV